jgi:hypothetical protein
VTVIEWWEANILRQKYPIPQKEFGGHFWIQVFNEETHRMAAALLLRETESIGHSEIIAIAVAGEEAMTICVPWFE